MIWAATLAAAMGLSSVEADLDAIAEAFEGKIGYSVLNLTTGERIERLGDERFPSASTIKTAIMLEALFRVEEGELEWSERLALPEQDARSASMWTYFFKPGLSIDVDALVHAMMSVSDNTATVVLADRLGNVEVTERLRSLGLRNTFCTVRAKPEEGELYTQWEAFRNMGVASPNDMTRLMWLLHRGELGLSEAANQRAVRAMSKQYWDDAAELFAPPDVVVAAKVGALNRSRSVVGIAYGPNPYAFAIYTDDQVDQRWTGDNAGDVALAKIAGLLWNAMNPDRPYAPPEGYERFKPTGGGVG